MFPWLNNDMIEGESEAEANLRTAVELGQKLLKRNQQLLEEHVTFRRLLSERDAAIAEMEERARQKGRSSGEGEAALKKLLEESEKKRLESERRALVAEDAVTDIRMQLEQRERVVGGSNAREKELMMQLTVRLSQMTEEMGKKEQEVERVKQQRDKLETLCDSLRSKVMALERRLQLEGGGGDGGGGGGVGGGGHGGMSRRSFHEGEDGEQSQVRDAIQRLDHVKRQWEQEKSLREEIEVMMREEKKRGEEKDAVITQLRSSMAELRDELEKREVEILRGKSFEELVSISPRSVMVTPTTTTAAATKKSDSSSSSQQQQQEDEILSELAKFKTLCAYRQAADEEFSARWQKLLAAIEAARMSVVEKDFAARGEKPSVKELKELTEARLEQAQDQAKLMALSSSLRDLPHGKPVFEFVQKHIGTVKALNVTMVELKLQQLGASPKKK